MPVSPIHTVYGYVCCMLSFVAFMTVAVALFPYHDGLCEVCHGRDMSDKVKQGKAKACKSHPDHQGQAI